MFKKLQTDTPVAKAVVTAAMPNSAAAILIKMQLLVNNYNLIKGAPGELAKAWKLTAWEFKVGMRELKKLDLVRKYTKTEYMLNPAYMYFGPDTQYFVVKHMWDCQTTQGLKQT